MVELFEILQREAHRNPSSVETFFSSHPSPQDRIQRLRESGASARRHTRQPAVPGDQGAAAEDGPAASDAYRVTRNSRRHSCPTVSHSNRAPTSSSTRTTPWTGIPGAWRFREGEAEDKPIFLSIGYSTCHWCHVMEHESFENAALAGLLNEHFVSIKVDREERPDVDRVYMTFVQVTTGSGGWPMSVWLTPALAPFYGGTCFPPTSRWGRPGFAEVLEEIVRVWREERGRVEHSAASIVERLRSFGGRDAGAGIPDSSVLDVAVRTMPAPSITHAGGSARARNFRGRASCCSSCASTCERVRTSRAT